METLFIFGLTENKENENENIKTVKSINFGNDHCIITDCKDNHWIHGKNSYGSLGIGTDKNVIGWQQHKYFVDRSIEIYKIFTSCYSHDTFWITHKLQLYCNGYNAYGQLGTVFVYGEWISHDEQHTPTHTPTIVPQLSNVIDVKCGWYHNVAICGSIFTEKKDIIYIVSYWMRYYNTSQKPQDIIMLICNYFGEIEARKIYSTGYNNNGRLGHGRSIVADLDKWTLITSFKNIKIATVSCGAGHTLFLDTMGRVYSCGDNKFGQLGKEHYAQNTYSPPSLLPYFSKFKIIIKKICSGYAHNICLDVNYIVYSWGWNQNGQCGVGGVNNLNRPMKVMALREYMIIDIKTGYDTSYAKSDKDCHFLWGNNDYGQCTLTNSDNKIQSIPMLINHAFYDKYSATRIKDVYLGVNKTYVVGAQ